MRDQRRGNEGLKGSQKVLEERMEEMRREQVERDKRWQDERKELIQRIEELEMKLGEIGKGDKSEEREREEGMIEVRIRKIEREWEMRERKERRRNLIVKGLEERRKEERG